MGDQGGNVPLITGFSRQKPLSDTGLQYGAIQQPSAMAYPQSGMFKYVYCYQCTSNSSYFINIVLM